MDLMSYLRPLRGYLVAIVLLSAVVGVGAAYLTAQRTQGSYRASLELSLPTVTGQPRELDQLTSDFVQGIRSGDALDAAARAAGRNADDVVASLTAARTTSTGAKVLISATGTDRTELARGVAAAAEQSYLALARPQLDAARVKELQLRRDYDEVKGSTAGADDDERRWQTQAEFAALREATDAKTAMLDMQIRMAAVQEEAAAGSVYTVAVDRRLPIAQSGLTSAGAALFALLLLLCTVELWRTHPWRRTKGRSSTVTDDSGNPRLESRTPVGASTP